MSRTKRKEYTKSKRFDASCRCHGGCSWCAGNRLYQDTRDRDAADEEISFTSTKLVGWPSAIDCELTKAKLKEAIIKKIITELVSLIRNLSI